MNIWKRRIQRLFGKKKNSEQYNSNVVKQNNNMPLTAELVSSMVQGVMSTRPDELDCDKCFMELDVFAEAHLVGKNVSEALPLVKDHLNRCVDCREEFEALLLALQIS